MIAIIRAMKKCGKTLEDALAIQVAIFRQQYKRVPGILGRLYFSRIGHLLLIKLARRCTDEDWETHFIYNKDANDVSVITKKCGVVEYLKSEKMFDYLKYCNFNDFLMFPGINIGVKQISTIDKGECTYCLKYKGKSEIPGSLDPVFNNSYHET